MHAGLIAHALWDLRGRPVVAAQQQGAILPICIGQLLVGLHHLFEFGTIQSLPYKWSFG